MIQTVQCMLLVWLPFGITLLSLSTGHGCSETPHPYRHSLVCKVNNMYKFKKRNPSKARKSNNASKAAEPGSYARVWAPPLQAAVSLKFPQVPGQQGSLFAAEVDRGLAMPPYGFVHMAQDLSRRGVRIKFNQDGPLYYPHSLDGGLFIVDKPPQYVF